MLLCWPIESKLMTSLVVRETLPGDIMLAEFPQEEEVNGNKTRPFSLKM